MIEYAIYYGYGILIMAMLESIQIGYEDRDLNGQFILNAVLWPLVLLSVIGRLIRALQNL